MGARALLAPLFVEVALTLVLLCAMGLMRVAAVRRGEVRTRDISLAQPAWPLRPAKFSVAFHNQFQLPVLFYLWTVLVLFTNKGTYLLVVLAWIFVVFRLVHALVIVTSNHVPTRFFWFAGGLVALSLMWAMFAIQILLGI